MQPDRRLAGSDDKGSRPPEASHREIVARWFARNLPLEEMDRLPVAAGL
jgi:hypothetical protein